MAEHISIQKTQNLMRTRLKQYIKSQYFGNSKLLLNASGELLDREGILYQRPYLESTPSYRKLENGILKSELPSVEKKVFLDLVNNGLGVFKTPFNHQIDSLNAFVNGKNLFVATGTGSGKTECFLWPIIYKLISEAINHTETWKKRGVRTILIYPMNSLVSDQISRLRSIIGPENDKFYEILKSYSSTARRPQFGMYTGRTPYSNDLNKKDNNSIAKALSETYLVDETLPENEKEEKQKEIEGLKKIHKYPAKNISKLVEALLEDDLEKYDNSEDAELMLRYEMQETTPDILITNYSMLEFMLIREKEQNIWLDTKDWLNSNDDNKLLIVIDEAHMYSGASGGEVALLIRRLFSKLGIDNKKIQFIMTSASMPNETAEDQKYILTFSENLSGCSSDSFVYLFGEKEEMKLKNPVRFKLEDLANLNLENENLSPENILFNVNEFSSKIFNETVDKEPQKWLFYNLQRFEPFVSLFNLCRGNAIPYDELKLKIFGEKTDLSLKAFENLLVLAPLAKDEYGNVLFPARVHSFFRGLSGIFACCNPNCTHKNTADGISLGALFSVPRLQCPYCHSKVYELLNDRRCGALYLNGYADINQYNQKPFYLWNKKGIDENNEMISCPLYILPEDYNIGDRPSETEVAYLDIKSGKVYSSKKASKEFIRVLRTNYFKDNKLSYKKCPGCDKKFTFIDLSDFKVKGNMPFYNIIKGQFEAQPKLKEETKYLPNGGKKVLLFSDSRQSAAILARDMTKLSDFDSFRQTIYMAMKAAKNEENGDDIALSLLYPEFLKICVENNLRFFYGKDLDKLEVDKNLLTKKIEILKTKGKKPKYKSLVIQFNKPCRMYQSKLIELFCSPMINFHELGLGYLVPIDEKLEEVLLELDDLDITEDEFISIFLSFVCRTNTDSFSFDNTVDENTRKEVKYKKGNRYGFINYSSYIAKEVKARFPDDYGRIYETIVENFYRKTEEDSYFLNIDTVKVVFVDSVNDKFVRCKKCGGISPFDVYGTCSLCNSKNIEFVKISDLHQIDYWRKPIVNNSLVRSLNTEEHTAQLSYKDQKIETWAKTEDYEMRFQDVNVEKEGVMPIDVLSCTTTMEVGIDIGSLTAIGMRNVPPLRENYQQRAGRAGRRGSSLSTITTYAQGGPHDAFYFKNPDEIIKGKPRKPWIDIKSKKIVFRHFNLIIFTRFFESIKKSFYSCTALEFNKLKFKFIEFVNSVKFTKEEIDFLFINNDIDIFKKELLEKIIAFLDSYDYQNKADDLVFDALFNTGILPTYSFPLDIIGFNIQDENGEIKLTPQRGIDQAISEYAPGRTIVVDKKTYKSGGLYSPIFRKDIKTPYAQAEPYFKEENGYFSKVYICSNRLCGWFSKEKPKNGRCPFCGTLIKNEEEERFMIRPWGFAPVNASDILESEAQSDMSYTDEPCYSATPNNDLNMTVYKNIMIANRKNEEILILNKGKDDSGFDVCKLCGAAQLHSDKSLKENGINAPYKFKGGKNIDCNHKNVATGIYLGTSFITDMFFMQIKIDTQKITNDYIILKSAAITLCEALRLAASRMLDIEYNDLKIGFRSRELDDKKYVDIYFYDSLSSGAGYSTQLASRLKEIFDITLEILDDDDPRILCNFWNQRVQYWFNKDLGKQLLLWAMNGELPNCFTPKEIEEITTPIIAILNNETDKNCSLDKEGLVIDNTLYKITRGFVSKGKNEISDFEIMNSLPIIINNI